MDDPRQAPRNIDALLAKVREIDELLRLPPGVAGRTDRICALAHSIAYLAPNHVTADLARKVDHEAREPDSQRISNYLSHLRAELQGARKLANQLPQ